MEYKANRHSVSAIDLGIWETILSGGVNATNDTTIRLTYLLDVILSTKRYMVIPKRTISIVAIVGVTLGFDAPCPELVEKAR